MTSCRRCVLGCLIVVGITMTDFAQKTKIGYDARGFSREDGLSIIPRPRSKFHRDRTHPLR